MTLVYLLAGEQSGDALGGRLMASMKTARPGLRFAGVGGPRMAQEGLQSLFPMGDIEIFGLAEILPLVGSVRRRLHEASVDIARRRPDVVVTIDSTGFALRLLRAIAPLGLRRVHYVAPNVWAWGERRARRFIGLWDRLLCLLPFEPAFYGRHGVPAQFVGHPVLESGAGTGDGARFRARHGLAADARIIVFMPGSRRSELEYLLPVFGRTIARLAARLPLLAPVLPVPAAVAGLVSAAARTWPVQPVMVTDLADKHDAFAAAEAALAKSGTSTLELALAGVPMVVTYRVGPLTAAVGRLVIRVPCAALVNLLAGRLVVPELLQGAATPERLAGALLSLLEDGVAAAAQRDAYHEILQVLRPPGGLPSEAAARAVLELIP